VTTYYNAAVLDAAEAKAESLMARYQAILDAASMRRGKEVLASEQRELDKIIRKVEKLNKNTITPQRAEQKRLANANAAIVRSMSGETRPVTHGTSRISVGVESSIYRPDTRDERGQEYGFFHDLYAASRTGDISARERLDRYAKEQRVNPNTSSGTGGELVPPLWLVQQFVPYLRPGRVTADRCQLHQLPPGTDVINLPKLTLGSLTGMQTANNAAVASRDITTTSVSASVNTLSGQEDISIQLLEQSPLAMDNVIFQDLAADYTKQLDLQVLSGTGANGQHTGVLQLAGTQAVTFTSGSPTVALLFPLVVQAIEMVTATRFLPPDAIVMHPRRWLWMASQLDTQNRTLVVPRQYAINEMAVADTLTFDSPVGEILGLPVWIDASMLATDGAGNNQDVIVVGRFDDSWLFESTMRLRSLPEILSGTLQVRFQCYGYSALAHRLPVSYALIRGTGLINPSGWV
jgi:HK97 family phage major capsid protein